MLVATALALAALARTAQRAEGIGGDLVDAAGFLHRFGEARAEVCAAGDDAIKRCVVVRRANDDLA